MVTRGCPGESGCPDGGVREARKRARRGSGEVTFEAGRTPRHRSPSSPTSCEMAQGTIISAGALGSVRDTPGPCPAD